MQKSGDRQPGARGLLCGGYSPNASTRSDEIQYINISSTGNAQDFGDLLKEDTPLSNSSSTRACIGGGNTPSGDTNTIHFVTIASTGNATNFGDLTQILLIILTVSQIKPEVFFVEDTDHLIKL